MAFTAGRTVVLGAGVAVALPAISDLGAVTVLGFTLYSHMRVPGGTTYTFDTGQAVVVPATTDTILAIPVNAATVTAVAASTAQLGQSL
jgi:hypothetical protein